MKKKIALTAAQLKLMVDIKKYNLTDTGFSGHEFRTLNNLVSRNLVLPPDAIIALSDLGEQVLFEYDKKIVMDVTNESVYMLNSTTKIKIIGFTKSHLIIEIGNTPTLTAQILKQKIIDGIENGSIVEVKT